MICTRRRPAATLGTLVIDRVQTRVALSRTALTALPSRTRICTPLEAGPRNLLRRSAVRTPSADRGRCIATWGSPVSGPRAGRPAGRAGGMRRGRSWSRAPAARRRPAARDDEPPDRASTPGLALVAAPSRLRKPKRTRRSCATGVADPIARGAVRRARQPEARPGVHVLDIGGTRMVVVAPTSPRRGAGYRLPCGRSKLGGGDGSRRHRATRAAVIAVVGLVRGADPDRRLRLPVAGPPRRWFWFARRRNPYKHQHGQGVLRGHAPALPAPLGCAVSARAPAPAAVERRPTANLRGGARRSPCPGASCPSNALSTAPPIPATAENQVTSLMETVPAGISDARLREDDPAR